MTKRVKRSYQRNYDKVVKVTREGLETFRSHNIVAIGSYIMISIMERALKDDGVTLETLHKDIKSLVPSWITFTDANLDRLISEMKSGKSITVE